MVTVAIMGILASMAVQDYSALVNHSRHNRAVADMAGLAATAMGNRAADDTVLSNVTGFWTTSCAEGFCAPGSAVGASVSDPIAIHSFNQLGFATVPVDPWGHVYLLEENEAEFGNNDCRYDTLWSAGPDGVFNGWGATGDSCSGDDVVFHIPHYRNISACAFISPGPAFGNFGCP